jgi:hypothetical protein
MSQEFVSGYKKRPCVMAAYRSFGVASLLNYLDILYMYGDSLHRTG